ncbi:uroporphyrinogen-III C-methyltransferase [Staphylococcus hominis]|uniref:uroporphyrinogen-III C-methyltransferase n=1 Tax=Staphylococcus hominis TaxID=1290 RepID=UPI00066D8DF6|nr:uroporphyrinogen-III C-methyltransferase [Staphylococcus hominis]MDU2145170.1 uroporphyrinogen-III C-methyltransferase [Staphylococcus sp.]OFK84448.1 uroporphyrin-III methyltransferase [Staphylococcus sp. HMSC057A02]SKU43217.1 multifunctional enzyme siroheme synthase CysG [Mycobacteroides abscessus subsp. abscessus]AUW63212.1 uroporphyrinogen-III C-methyltransferase [Staphylococcus hominis]MBC3078932.1 uroporphyrinogen-III C-methyltransferase [Staphylococcus hominis]
MSLVTKSEFGKVYLIGAGPGNPNLLTKQAERLIRQADVILYDRLVNPLILQYAKPTTEIIDVGKKPYTKHIQQEGINLKIVAAAKKYKIVVRLKGGDPAVFGRVTEEIDILKEHQIAYDIVPGVTSASAAVASLDLGLTMRSVAPSVTFSTGHFKDDIDQDMDIRNLANGGTLAIYMGIKRLNDIINQIRRYTKEDYDIAIIFNATCYNETIVVGKLSTIEHQLSKLNIKHDPGICILGHIINYMDDEKIIHSKQTIDETLYVIKGNKDLALSKAEDLSQQYLKCLIQYDETYHSSQKYLYESIITQHQNIKYIEV